MLLKYPYLELPTGTHAFKTRAPATPLLLLLLVVVVVVVMVMVLFLRFFYTTSYIDYICLEGIAEHSQYQTSTILISPVGSGKLRKYSV